MLVETSNVPPLLILNELDLLPSSPADASVIADNIASAAVSNRK
jgi:hypothetical protein